MLTTRPFAASDIGDLITWFPDIQSVVQWAGPRLHAPLDAPQLQPLLQARESDGQWVAWTAYDDAQRRVGHFELLFDHVCGQATLGRVAIAPRARGRGYANPMVRLAMEIAFGRTDIHRVELRVFDFNVAAIAAYERLGFVKEGTCREAVRVGADAWNAHIMSMLRREWEGAAPPK